MQPSFQDEKPVNPFDMGAGADFKLKIRQVEGYRNYDKSEFSGPTALYEGDETRLEAVYNQVHNLGEFTDPKNYKTYDELKTKLARVLGEEANAGAPTVTQMNQVNEPAPQYEVPTAETTTVSESDEDTMSYFARLANDG